MSKAKVKEALNKLMVWNGKIESNKLKNLLSLDYKNVTVVYLSMSYFDMKFETKTGKEIYITVDTMQNKLVEYIKR